MIYFFEHIIIIPDEFHNLFLTNSILIFSSFYLDFSKFSEMLMMEPAMSRIDGLKFKSKLTESDILKMRERVRNEFGRIHFILKTVSSYLLLVFRYFLFKI